jgi:hypothetical protein
MEPITIPQITVAFTVDVDVAYDAFEGRTQQEMAELLKEKLDDLLAELDDRVVYCHTRIDAIYAND